MQKEPQKSTKSTKGRFLNPFVSFVLFCGSLNQPAVGANARQSRHRVTLKNRRRGRDVGFNVFGRKNLGAKQSAVRCGGGKLGFGEKLGRVFSFLMRNRQQARRARSRSLNRRGSFALQPEQNRFVTLRRHRGVGSSRNDEKRNQSGDQK